jgi:hypothetical protein
MNEQANALLRPIQSYSVRLPEWCDQREVMLLILGHRVASRRGMS